LDQVLKLWQGLGYYARARNLHVAAKQVVTEFGGVFPEKYEDLIKIKGIGDYTASAISSFAFDEPNAVLDGNVIRVLSRYFGICRCV
jgi:A/G-specific adenine glycosylase